MYKEIEFSYPFSGFARLDFTNCFASTYMFFDGYDGTKDCYCGSKLKICDNCGDCDSKALLAKKQEDLFFYFGTMTGRNALRAGFDGPTKMQQQLDDTDELIDFTMRIAGYEYKKATNGFKDAICESINAGRPVLARVKREGRGNFRVINGYDGDTLKCPEPNGAQRKPDRTPTYEDIEEIYVITSKSTPTLDMKDCFEQIVKVMEYNRDIAIWDDYVSYFNNYRNDLARADFDEIKRRFKRISDIMGFTHNCHNFSETFNRELYHRIVDTNLRDFLYSRIEAAYRSTHDLAWQVIALNGCRDWSKRQYHEWESGMCNNVVMCLNQLKKNDEIVLDTMQKAIRMVSTTSNRHNKAILAS